MMMIRKKEDRYREDDKGRKKKEEDRYRESVKWQR